MFRYAVWGAVLAGAQALATAAPPINWSAEIPLLTPFRTGSLPSFDIETGGQGLWICLASTNTTYPWHGDRAVEDGDIVVRRSTDNGATWSEVTPLHPYFVTDIHEDESIDLAADGSGVWIATWIGGPLRTVHVSRSSDGGNTWSEPGPPGNSPGLNDAAREVIVTTDRQGRWLILWHAEAEPEPAIVAVRSTDDGLTWGPPVTIGLDSAIVFAAPHLQLVTNGDGLWVAAWHSQVSHLVRTARSTDHGLTWGPAQDLRGGQPAGLEEYFSAPALAIGANDALVVAANGIRYPTPITYTAGLYSARSLDGGQTWTPLLPAQDPAAPFGEDIVPDRAQAMDNGAWSLSWTDPGDPVLQDHTAVRVATTADGGATWTSRSLARPRTDYFRHTVRHLRSADGVWIVVWREVDRADTRNTALVLRRSPPLLPLTDVNQDGAHDAADIQLVINAVLGRADAAGDANDDGRVDASDIQRVINTVLGF